MKRARTGHLTVRVDFCQDGKWRIVITGERPQVCDTLEEAERIAYRFAEGAPSCELIVRNAYHHVICRELPGQHGAHGERR